MILKNTSNPKVALAGLLDQNMFGRKLEDGRTEFKIYGQKGGFVTAVKGYKQYDNLLTVETTNSFYEFELLEGEAWIGGEYHYLPTKTNSALWEVEHSC